MIVLLEYDEGSDFLDLLGDIPPKGIKKVVESWSVSSTIRARMQYAMLTCYAGYRHHVQHHYFLLMKKIDY
jgi:hypothetical protein